MTATFTYQVSRPPTTPNELYELVKLLWGVTIPRNKACVHHDAPFTAFSEAFFADYPVTVWKGSRGLAGKSKTLAYLSLTEAVIYGAKISLLGGSFEQSKNISMHMREGWDWKLAPKQMVVSDNINELILSNGARVRPLTASQRTVRGPHPVRLRLDEVDEMDLAILDAALGQPMPQKTEHGVLQTQTVMSSTLQYPNGTMAEAIARAIDRGQPVRSWCHLDTANPIDGWLDPKFIERKRQEVSEVVWKVEYELQEPSIGTRAIDTTSVERMFDVGDPYDSPSTRVGANMEIHVFEEEDYWGEYVISADWAKESDFTVISVWRIDNDKFELVAYRRTNRLPWPVMISWFNEWQRKYRAKGIHDGTGIGNVVNDYITDKSWAFQMSGRARADMLTEYVAAVEKGIPKAPRIASAYREHLYVSFDDMYSTGKEFHLPDAVCAFALAWKATGRKVSTMAPIIVSRLNDNYVEEMEVKANSSPWHDVGGKVTHAQLGFNPGDSFPTSDKRTTHGDEGWDLSL